MNSPQLIIFDDGLGDFGPLGDLRSCYDLLTGTMTTRQRIENALSVASTVIPTQRHCRAQQPSAGPDDKAMNALPSQGMVLLVSGRITTHVSLPAIASLREPVIHVTGDGQLLWAWLPVEQAARLMQQAWRPAGDMVVIHTVNTGQRLLWDRPWHILDTLESTLRYDLEIMTQRDGEKLPAYVHAMGAYPIHTCNSRLQPGVVLNAELGPIVIEADTIIGAHSVIEGPCYVGTHTQLAAHTYLRPNTVIGPSCKFAGEVSFSLVQGFSNKAHLGYLGHALVGQWVNLGASTTVSNLKNTYGSVRVQMHPDQASEDTKRMFQGPIIGDFVRTAIGTRILTGSCLNTGSMIALSNYAPKCSKPFGFYTDDSPDGEPYDPDKFIATAQAMLARRKVEMTKEFEGKLRELMVTRV